jgi:hypothetical protein
MEISDDILEGFDYLPKTPAVIDGTDVDVLFNMGNFRDNKVLGGYEPDENFIVFFKTSEVPNVKALKGKPVVLKDNDLRVVNVRYGAIIKHLEGQSINKR